MSINKLEFVRRVLEFFAYYDIAEDLFWDSDLNFFIKCSDEFAYACADLEPLSDEQDLKDLEQCVKDCSKRREAGICDASTLYVARRRKMRPLPGLYKHLEKENYYLFDACGPEK